MNYLPVLVGTIINMIIGALWYSPVLFAKPWMAAVGKDEKDLKKNSMSIMYTNTLVTALIESFVLFWLIRSIGVTNVIKGIELGLLIGVGFIATASLSDFLFSGRPLKLYIINVGYYIVVLALMGALFTIWH